MGSPLHLAGGGSFHLFEGTPMNRGRLLPAGVLALTLVTLVVAADPPADGKSDRATLVQGNSEFAFDLYGKLRAGDSNLFFSPYSISTALAMTAAGARGPTAEEMARTLHFTLPGPRLHVTMGALIKDLSG